MTVSSIFKKYDEACFRKLEHQTLLSFSDKDDFVMSCGGGTPCFCENMEQMNALGVTIYIKLTASELADRIANSVKKRPLTEGKSDEELARLHCMRRRFADLFQWLFYSIQCLFHSSHCANKPSRGCCMHHRIVR